MRRRLCYQTLCLAAAAIPGATALADPPPIILYGPVTAAPVPPAPALYSIQVFPKDPAQYPIRVAVTEAAAFPIRVIVSEGVTTPSLAPLPNAPVLYYVVPGTNPKPLILTQPRR